MKLSIVIPAFNEASRLPATLAAIEEHMGPEGEVIVVDDGSVDGTAERVRADVGSGISPRLIRSEQNRGKGAAVREGVLAANGEYVLFMDADNSTHIKEVDKLLWWAERGAHVVIGSRYIEPDRVKIRQPRYRIWLSRAGNGLIRLLLLRGISDTQCGFKLFSREAARRIFALQRMDGFSFDIELLAIAKQLGYPPTEVPVDWYDRPGTRLRPVRSSVQTLGDLIRIRWYLTRGRYEPMVADGADGAT